jgi:hypothetical protein
MLLPGDAARASAQGWLDIAIGQPRGKRPPAT